MSSRPRVNYHLLNEAKRIREHAQGYRKGIPLTLIFRNGRKEFIMTVINPVDIADPPMLYKHQFYDYLYLSSVQPKRVK